METLSSSETLVPIDKIVRRNIPEQHNHMIKSNVSAVNILKRNELLLSLAWGSYSGDCEQFCRQEHKAVRSVDFRRTARRYIPEDSNPHSYRSENLKPHIN
jgi:hypothetical protein